MADISIPGVSDKYKTNDFVDALMKKERIPLTREQESLDRYKEQQNAWRDINQKMSSLRESTKTLYSFENPFNNKIASSSDERAITADAGREASFESIKIDVIKEATSDRFLSAEIDKSLQIPKGKYTFQVGEKTLTFNWKGGKLSEFVSSLNKRGTNTIKASLVGVSSTKSSLLIESLKTGNDNNLIFRDDALTLALNTKLIEKTKKDITEFGSGISEFENPPAEQNKPSVEQDGMPEMTTEKLSYIQDSQRTVVPPRSGLSIKIDPSFHDTESQRVEFSFSLKEVDDITEELNIKRTTRPELPEPGSVTYEQLIMDNRPSETNLPPIPSEPLIPITNSADFYIHNTDGTESKLSTEEFQINPETNEKTINIQLKEYPDAESIVLRNRNTGTTVELSSFAAYDEKKNLGYTPINPISQSGDAVIKYEGITITRPENKIDDVIPHVTLNVHQPTSQTATIDIRPDKDSAKDALIQFVGRYNQVLAEMNILSENKPEIIAELDYLSKDEQDELRSKLGMFQGDFSLSNGKSALRSITTANYRWSENAEITMLNQIGISSRASGGSGSSYNAAQMRGYLEIDEKKLDSALDSNLDQIKNIFGYDSDGDLIIDSGIGYALDKQLTSWVQSGGIIATKNSGLDTKIKASENNIRKFESQLAGKESQLRNKYGQMEGTLNNLNAQANSISNFANSRKE